MQIGGRLCGQLGRLQLLRRQRLATGPSLNAGLDQVTQTGLPDLRDGSVNKLDNRPEMDHPPDATNAGRTKYERPELTPLTRWWNGVTMDLNFDFNAWRRLQSQWRHLRLWTPGSIASSMTLRRLVFPDLLAVGTTAGAVVWYNMTVVPHDCEVSWVDSPGFDLLIHHDILSISTVHLNTPHVR